MNEQGAKIGKASSLNISGSHAGVIGDNAAILHLSDLHFGTMADAKRWHTQLAGDLKNELQCNQLAAIIISGDIANFSVEEEYKAAKKFITALQQEFGVKAEGIIMVPGNHDLNWTFSKKKGYSLTDRDEVDGELEPETFIPVDDEVIRLRDDDGYPKRFANFCSLYEAITTKPYPADPAGQGMLHHLPALNLLVLGLNSCWQLDHHFKNRASIHAGSLAHALDLIRNDKIYQQCLKFAVWHHPLNSPDQDRIKEHGFLEQLARDGFCLALHGHIHKAATNCFRYDQTPDSRKIEIVGAGTFGAPIREWQPGIPLQYNLLQLHNYTLTVHTRKREKPAGAWQPDARWTSGPGQDPLPRYDIVLPHPSTVITAESSGLKKTGRSEETSSPLIFPEIYSNWLKTRCSKMDIDRLRERNRVVQVDLPELFIRLYTNPLDSKPQTSADEAAGMLRQKMEPLDIENLIRQEPYLLIKGQAGSGKTTLFKHCCLSLLEKNSNGEDLLPVLVFLKDCRHFDLKSSPVAGCRTAEAILHYLWQQTGNGLAPDTVSQYCRAGKVLFLFDGLDEIDRNRRDLIVQSFADFREQHPGCSMVFSGRPHGIEGAVIERFGDRLAEILPLTMQQVELFVKKWFCTIMETNGAVCGKTATNLLDEMKTHPAIDTLKDTPLMLTAICLLYYDNKELPGQRAELYKKFIEFLIYRRFREDPEKVLIYLRRLAMEMYSQRVRSINRNEAIRLLRAVFPPQKEEAGEQYTGRLGREFDRIEPDSGLLRLENGMYEFWHLSFQEFLTAAYLADNVAEDVSEPVREYWQDKWWLEVVELYVGYLSINNNGLANGIVRKALAEVESAPYTRQRLAARALASIHVDRRNLQVVSEAAEHLRIIMTSQAQPVDRLDAGQLLGRLGDSRDLKEFIPLAGGSYEMQDNTVTLQPFEIGKFPVTNVWFAEFIKAGGYLQEEYWSEEGRKWLAWAGSREPGYWRQQKWNCPNAPVVGVCWYEAFAFTRWLSAIDERCDYFLPTEEQWQAAAQGKEGRKYPWKGDWQEDYCNSKECKLEQTSSVGMFPNGATPAGVEDLVGNIWEWMTSDYYSGKKLDDFSCDSETNRLYLELKQCTDEQQRNSLVEKFAARLDDKQRQLPVFWGGSWNNYREYARCAARTRLNPNYRSYFGGFRCARILL